MSYHLHRGPLPTRLDPEDDWVFEVYVSGIPALAFVTSYSEGHPGVRPRTNTRGPWWAIGYIDHGEPPEPEELDEFLLYDRKGYRAHWLERKADALGLWPSLSEQVLLAIHDSIRDREADIELARAGL